MNYFKLCRMAFEEDRSLVKTATWLGAGLGSERPKEIEIGKCTFCQAEKSLSGISCYSQTQALQLPCLPVYKAVMQSISKAVPCRDQQQVLFDLAHKQPDRPCIYIQPPTPLLPSSSPFKEYQKAASSSL